MITPDELAGKVALVTGGSRGIGRGIALKLAQAGANVLITYLEREDSAWEVVKWIEGMGRKAHAIRADVAREPEVERMIAEVQSKFERLDILVNNVGPFKMKRIADMLPEEWRLMIDGNLNSAYYCVRHVVPIMRAQKEGLIIFIGAPNAERVGSAFETCAYSIAKTGVVILAQTLAREEAANGIRANVVNPGFIENDAMTASKRAWMPREVPLNRVGSPADIGEAVLFLASPSASYVNGAVLNVHGGLWI
ncbi:MAG: SDR family oxidoreductase [bacterium]